MPMRALAVRVRAVTINKDKALDACLRDWFVSYFCVCVPFSFRWASCCLTALRWGSGPCCWRVSCLSTPALTLNQQIGINKAARLLVPGKGQPLSKQFLFDNAYSENSMLGWGHFKLTVVPIYTPKDPCCLWCVVWFIVGECSQCLTQGKFSPLLTFFQLDTKFPALLCSRRPNFAC